MKKNWILSGLVMFMMGSCGGGGGGGGGSTAVGGSPSVTSATTYTLSGSIFTSDSIGSATVCMDENFSFSCESGELQTTSLTGSGPHTFDITTTNQTRYNNMRNNRRPVLAEIVTNAGDSYKLWHPGVKVSMDAGLGEEVSLTGFTTLFNGGRGVLNPLIRDDLVGSVSDPAKTVEAGYYNHVDWIFDLVESKTTVTKDDILSGIVGTDPLTESRNGRIIDFLKLAGDIDKTMRTEMESELNSILGAGSAGTFVEDALGIQLASIVAGAKLSSRTRLTTQNLWIFLSPTFPNDVFGNITSLSYVDDFSVPIGVHVEAEIPVNNDWTIYTEERATTRLASRNNQPNFASSESSCTTSPSVSCLEPVTLANIHKPNGSLLKLDVMKKESSNRLSGFHDYTVYPSKTATSCYHYHGAKIVSTGPNDLTETGIQTVDADTYDFADDYCPAEASYASNPAIRIYKNTFFESGKRIYQLFRLASSNDDMSNADSFFSNVPNDVYEELEISADGTSSLTGAGYNQYLDLLGSNANLAQTVEDITEVAYSLSGYRYFYYDLYPRPGDPRSNYLYYFGDGELNAWSCWSGDSASGEYEIVEQDSSTWGLANQENWTSCYSSEGLEACQNAAAATVSACASKLAIGYTFEVDYDPSLEQIPSPYGKSSPIPSFMSSKSPGAGFGSSVQESMMRRSMPEG